MRALLVALVLAVCARTANACPDADTALGRVTDLLRWDDGAENVPGWGDSQALSDAYESLADSWTCAHVGADAAEFAAWISTIPGASGSHAMSESPPHLVIDDSHVFVVWRRSDMSDGGRAVLYSRETSGTWVAAGAIKLTAGLMPRVFGRLGDRVVISELTVPSNYLWCRLRVFRIDADTGLAEEPGLGDLFECQVQSHSRRSIRVEFQRKAHFSDGGTVFINYDLTIRRGRAGLIMKVRPRDPGLDLLNRYCAAESSKDRRSLVKSKKLAARLPACSRYHVQEVVHARKKTRIQITGRFTCPASDGSTRHVDDATLTISKVKGALKITGFSAKGCPRGVDLILSSRARSAGRSGTALREGARA